MKSDLSEASEFIAAKTTTKHFDNTIKRNRFMNEIIVGYLQQKQTCNQRQTDEIAKLHGLDMGEP